MKTREQNKRAAKMLVEDLDRKAKEVAEMGDRCRKAILRLLEEKKELEEKCLLALGLEQLVIEEKEIERIRVYPGGIVSGKHLLLGEFNYKHEDISLLEEEDYRSVLLLSFIEIGERCLIYRTKSGYHVRIERSKYAKMMG
jgi:hypothetical protein